MLSNTEMGSFFENIGMMIKAGISVNEAVDLLREESEAEKPRLVKTYEKMSEDMHAGSSLEMAMKESGQFPEYAVDMIGASEYTGRLEDTLFHLAEYYRTEHSMKNIFVSAVRYPIIRSNISVSENSAFQPRACSFEVSRFICRTGA